MMRRTTASVYVCALRHVSEMVEHVGARHLVSAIDTDLQPDTPAGLLPGRHLRLDMHDIVEERQGSTLPAKEHVVELLEYVRSWDQDTPILVHCFAGLSRSTAAAFIALCAVNPATPEEIIARDLRRLSATATPNRLFVALADTALRRDGRMIAAVNAMGQSRTAVECIPFMIPALYAGVRRERDFRRTTHPTDRMQ